MSPFDTMNQHDIPRGIRSALEARAQTGLLRSLNTERAAVDLCSNDYLGLGRETWPDAVFELAAQTKRGAGASRLVSGNSPELEQLESYLAAFYGAQAATFFCSGYEANTALLGALGERSDTIVYDELVHASIRDGIRLSRARSFSFRHNDLSDLRAKLDRARGERYVVVESVYSMDGDTVPLSDLVALCREHGAFLIVDEAHSTGVYHDDGSGFVRSLGVERDVFARVHTFGKGVGYRGACVVGDRVLREFLVNFARPFIYTTAPDPMCALLVRSAHERVGEAVQERKTLWELVSAVRTLRNEFPSLELLPSDSPVQGVVVSGNERVVRVEEALRRSGFEGRAIRSPTVPAGRERIRLCLHSFNTVDEVRRALSVVAEELAESLDQSVAEMRL